MMMSVLTRRRRIALALAFAWIGGVVAWLATRESVPVEWFKVTKTVGMNGRMVVRPDGSVIAGSLEEVVHRSADGRRLWGVPLGVELGSGGHYPDVAELSDGSILTAYAVQAQKGFLVWLTNGVIARRREMPFALPPGLGGFAMVTAQDIAVPTTEGLVVLRQDGTERWRFPTSSVMYHLPAVAPDGGYLFETGGGATNPMTRLRADGSLRWERPSDVGYGAYPTFRSDGSFLWGRGPGLTLAAFDAEGLPLWQMRRPEAATSAPVFGSGGVAYVGVQQPQHPARLLAVEPHGAVRWEAELGKSLVLHQPVVGPDGSVYVVTMDRWVWAFDEKGNPKWSYRVPWRMDRYLPRTVGELQAWWRRRMGYARPVGHGPPQLDSQGVLWVNFDHLGSVFRFQTKR